MSFFFFSTVKDPSEIIQNKFAILEAEQYLLQNLTKNNEKLVENTKQIEQEVSKFIFPLDETFIPPNLAKVEDEKNRKLKIDKMKNQRKELLIKSSSLKRQIAEIEIHEEELHRDIELEYALITGEHKSKTLEIEKIQDRKDKLLKFARQIEENMIHRQGKQGEDQQQCKAKLQFAQENMRQIEETLANTFKEDAKYEEVFEEYLKAQELLDNERKVFEDLEFHHLEEEADWLASREEIQREILELSRQIDSIKEQIQELEQQKYNTCKNNNSEFKNLKRRRMDCVVQLEKVTIVLRLIESELSLFSNQESDPDESTDSDSDKSKSLNTQLSNVSLNNIIHDMSYSVIVSNSKTPIDHVYNMSQSFNEKLLQEKSILESGTKFPSQDDIDRISKVTSSAPINIENERGSLGRKTIESLKDIERKRHLHLCQQGKMLST